MKFENTGYHTWAALGALALVACSSNGSAKPGAEAGGPQSSTTAAPANGPLPLMAANAQRVTYTVDGAPKEMLDFPNERVKVSASCAKPDGSLDCEAMRLLRKGKTVQLTPTEISAGLPPGAVVCRKLSIQSTTGRGPSGAEDGFCQLADGSLVAHGSVESHVLQTP